MSKEKSIKELGNVSCDGRTHQSGQVVDRGGVSTNTKRSSVQGSGKGSQKVEKRINQVAGLGGKWGGNTTKKEESIRVGVLPQ